MKTMILIFLIALSFVGMAQVTSVEDNFSTLDNWSRVGTKATLSISDNTMTFATKEAGISKLMNGILIDFSNDFSIEFDGVCNGALFTILLNGSGDGYNSLHFRIGSTECSIEKWANDNQKKIGKKKFKPYAKLSDGFTISIKQVNKILTVKMTNKKTGTVYELFSDEYPLIAEYPMFGFSIYQGTKATSLEISNFKMSYVPYVPKGINLLANSDKFGKKINLGTTVNTRIHEISPKISSDGTTLYFTSEDQIQTPYYSELIGDEWQKAKPVSSQLFPSDQHNSITAITTDLNTIFISGKWENGHRTSSLGISKSVKTKSGWSTPTALEIDGYVTTADLANTISADQRYIVSALDNKKSFGGTDLFVFFRQPDGSYGNLTNLGPIVNSKLGESTPYLAPDNKTLYFNSFGHPGYGECDIFVTRRLDETWTNWSVPENLGPKVNTPDWDGYYTVSAKGDFAYMTTYWQTEGLADVVKIELPQEAKPQPMLIIKGKVLNKKTNLPIGAEILFNDISKNDNPGIGSSDPQNGNYQVVLPYGQFFQIYAALDGYYALSEHLDLTTMGEFKIIEKDIYLTPIEVGEVFRLNNIFFETGSADLKAESNEELNRLIKFLNDNPSIKIRINGHTDDVGSNADNLALSKKRAKSVLDYLIAANIAVDRILSEGYGEEKPVETNDTEAGKAMNRRVEFEILSK